ncbi:Uma2 family endonuclease [Spirulina sp. CS-785/01]|uniref:Uma2 family endonuclease n=1 Tax=Spirulina sp. CS-785/01 TaxID=3021716 RepID=UPI00232F26C8|nr:Uma2 family endonuclease [Spirulina sp. CS-785/01]MDB9315554.1 Uma2 family endonuclease [Spirulina sp. CS-785/01]
MTSTSFKQRYSFVEYVQLDHETAQRYELVDGRLERLNPPTFRHLLIAKFIERLLEMEIDRMGEHWLCFREAGIRTGVQKARLTDVSVVRAEQVWDFLDQSAICQTPPLLAVEVVSQESINRDYRYKRSEYAALGVEEYWIIDPLAEKVSILVWEEGFYNLQEFTGEQGIISPLFPQLGVTVADILASGRIG